MSSVTSSPPGPGASASSADEAALAFFLDLEGASASATGAGAGALLFFFLDGAGAGAMGLVGMVAGDSATGRCGSGVGGPEEEAEGEEGQRRKPWARRARGATTAELLRSRSRWRKRGESGCGRPTKY